uniref:SelT-like protein n=1 Tax=Caenorhabditis tropicalis TaxID=1561998 RepID=A0A1I7T987_9PELO
MSRAGVFIIGVLFLMSICDVLRTVSAEEHAHDEDHAHAKDDFETEFGDENTDNSFSQGTEEEHIEVREQSSFVKPTAVHHAKDLPTLRVFYCVSCGYKQAFDQFTTFAKEKYPNMPVEGANFAPVLWKAYVAQAVSFIKMALLVIVLTGSNPLERLGLGYPGILQHAHGNKMSSCMLLFMLGNLVEQSLISTGAFEIYLGNEQIWSKIESGRVPSPQEFMQLIDAQLAVLGKAPVNTESFGEFQQTV